MTRLHEWNFLGLPLVTRVKPNAGFWFRTKAAGLDLGEPGSVRIIRDSLLLDGDDEVIDRYTNREIPFVVAVCGYTPADITAGERELAIRLGQPGILEWVPPKSGPRTWYDVRTSTMKFVGNDLEWLKNEIHQAYQFTVRAAPWGWSSKVAREAFAPATSSLSVVSDGSSATNWPGLTAGTYLTQSVVSTDVFEATSVVEALQGGGQWTKWNSTAMGVGVADAPYTPSLSGTDPFVFADVAFEGVPGLAPQMMTATPKHPVAQVSSAVGLAAGYTRYFWVRPTSDKVTFRAINPTTSPARMHINQMGTSTGVPGGSIYVLSSVSSVRTPVRLHLAIANGENMLYSDPTMLTHAWSPSVGETWENAPEGTYYLWVKPPLRNGGVLTYVSGDSFSITIAGQTKSTRVLWAQPSPATDGRWFPIGPFHFGTSMSRRIGDIGLDDQMPLNYNGVLMDTDAEIRLIREDEDAVIFYARDCNQHVFIDPATFDRPRPGVFTGNEPDGSDAESILATTDSWAWITIVPPVTPMWYQNGTSGQQAGFEMLAESRPAGHTFAPDVPAAPLVVGDPTDIDPGGG
jgi:hypothetical protein